MGEGADEGDKKWAATEGLGQTYVGRPVKVSGVAILCLGRTCKSQRKSKW